MKIVKLLSVISIGNAIGFGLILGYSGLSYALDAFWIFLLLIIMCHAVAYFIWATIGMFQSILYPIEQPAPGMLSQYIAGEEVEAGQPVYVGKDGKLYKCH